MSPMKLLKKYLREIFDVQGRLPRGRFWFLHLIFFIISVIAQILIILLGFLVCYIAGMELNNYNLVALLNMSNIIVGIPYLLGGLALFYRRTHDVNLPFWLFIIPIINIILSVYIGIKKGTVGTNKYGADPLETK